MRLAVSRSRFRGVYTVLCLLAIAGVEPVMAQGAAEAWRVGIGRRAITPQTPVWLAGYGMKRAPEGKIHDLWVKVLALRAADGKRIVMATTDHMGMSKTIYESLFAKLERRFSLDRSEFMLTFSHNHCGPVLKDDLVVAGPIEATAIGNILMQAVGLGQLESLSTARAIVRQSFQPEKYEPRPATGWTAAYQHLCELLPA